MIQHPFTHTYNVKWKGILKQYVLCTFKYNVSLEKGSDQLRVTLYTLSIPKSADPNPFWCTNGRIIALGRYAKQDLIVEFQPRSFCKYCFMQICMFSSCMHVYNECLSIAIHVWILEPAIRTLKE